jgi:hypothetical protein
VGWLSKFGEWKGRFEEWKDVVERFYALVVEFGFRAPYDNSIGDALKKIPIL